MTFVWANEQSSTFRDNLSVPSSGAKDLDPWTCEQFPSNSLQKPDITQHAQPSKNFMWTNVQLPTFRDYLSVPSNWWQNSEITHSCLTHDLMCIPLRMLLGSIKMAHALQDLGPTVGQQNLPQVAMQHRARCNRAPETKTKERIVINYWQPDWPCKRETD